VLAACWSRAGVSAARITSELRAALDDRSVRTARAVEALLSASIVVLMVLKP
jgi:hypothetical protein